MPIYGFECTACGHSFDRLQKLSDPDPETCPACAAAQVKRQITAPSFRLAGSGWYETDFKKDGDRKRNLVEKGDGGGKSDGGGEKPAGDKADKPAAKADVPAKAAEPAKPAKPAAAN
jgi:putative FmdB family regulatory protein